MTTLGDAAARGAGVTLAGQACRIVLQTVSIIALTRLLAPADFGLVAMVVAITGVAEIIRDFGLAAAAIQSRVLTDAERTNLFWVNVAIGVGCAGVVALSAPLFVALYDEPRLETIIYVVAGVFIVTGANTQFRAELSRSLRFRAVALADVVAQAVGIAVAIGLAVAGAGFWAIVAQQIAVAVVTLVVNAVTSSWFPGLPRRSVSIRRFFRFGGGLLGSQLLYYVTKNVDNVAIGAYWGATQLGLYSRGYQLVMMPLSQINAPLTSVALPVLARVQDDPDTFARYLHRAQIVGCYLTATVMAVCAGLAEPIVDVLFGPVWADAAPVVAILAVGGMFRAVAQLPYWVYLSRGLTGAQLRLFLVVRPVQVGLILAGLPWGIEGVAVGASAGAVLEWLVPMWHVGRVAGTDAAGLIRRAAVVLATVSVPCAVLAHAAALPFEHSLLRLAAGLAVVLAYLTLLACAVPRVRADLRVIVSFARRAVHGSARPDGPGVAP